MADDDPPTLLLLDNILSSIAQNTSTKSREKRKSQSRRRSGNIPRFDVSDDDTQSIEVKYDKKEIEESEAIVVHNPNPSSSVADRIPKSFQRRMKQADKLDRQKEITVNKSTFREEDREEKEHQNRDLNEAEEMQQLINSTSSLALSLKNNNDSNLSSDCGSSGGVGGGGEKRSMPITVATHQQPTVRYNAVDDDDEEDCSNPHDKLAVDTWKDFELELGNWWLEHDQEEPKHRYEAFANYLNTRYIYQSLDQLKRSPVVSTITKKVAKALEDLSNGKKAPTLRSKTQLQQTNHQKPLMKPASERRQRTTNQTLDSNYGTTSTSTTSGGVVAVVANKSTGKRHWCTIKDGDWNCSTCSKLNYEEDEKCVVCGRKKVIIVKKDKEEQDEIMKLKLDLKQQNKSLYSSKEKAKNDEMEKIQNDYKSFMQTKLRLDNHAEIRRDFASEIQSVLSGLQSSSSPDDPLVSQQSEIGKSPYSGNPFLVDDGQSQLNHSSSSS